MGLRIQPLTIDTPAETLFGLDDILRAAKASLIRPRERLEAAEERALDAGEHRLVLWAALGDRPVGLVDAWLHHPDPGALTVSQLAVCRSARFRGVGKALVREVVERAEAAAGELDVLYAAVLPREHSARAFWATLGFEPAEGSPDLLVHTGRRDDARGA